MNQLPTSRPVMNSPADEAEARDRANTAPQQADPDALCRGETGVSSGSEARPVTATEQSKNPMWVTCSNCDHRWIGLYLPMPISDAARAMGRLTCPKCACTKILVKPDTIKTESGHTSCPQSEKP